MTAKLHKVLTYKKWQRIGKELGFSHLDVKYIESEWGTQINTARSEYTPGGIFDGGITVPKRLNTPEGVFIRISDVSAGHVIVRNSSNSLICLMDLKTLKLTQTIAEFPKDSKRKDNLCFNSSNKNIIIYKPTESASEIYVIKKDGETLSSEVIFPMDEKDSYLCTSLAFHPNQEKEGTIACVLSNSSGCHPALYDIAKSDLFINKKCYVADHMIKFTRNGSYIIALSVNQGNVQCNNLILMTPHNLTPLYKFPLVPTVSVKNIDVISSICGFRFAVFGNKRLGSYEETSKQKRPISIRCWRHLCPVSVTLFKITTPEISLTRLSMKVIAVQTDYRDFDQLPLPKAVIALLKSV